MKKIYFLFWLVLSFIRVSLAQVYPVPGAQIQPSWVFPLWFEDGSGAKDTLYFCYDPNAHTGPPLDTLYGEIRTIMDTSKFSMFFDCSFGPNFEVLKVSLKDTSDLDEGICAWHAYMPIKIKWDRNLFYSDSIPYPNQDPAPRAKGNFYFDIPTISLDPEPNCIIAILMTDTVIAANCYATDSILLGGGFAIWSFAMAPWDGLQWGGGTEVNKPKEVAGIRIYPNLISTVVNIDNQESHSYSYSIFNIYGETILKGNILPFARSSLHSYDWKVGLYLFQAVDPSTGKIFSFKLLKPN